MIVSVYKYVTHIKKYQLTNAEIKQIDDRVLELYHETRRKPPKKLLGEDIYIYDLDTDKELIDSALRGFIT